MSKTLLLLFLALIISIGVVTLIYKSTSPTPSLPPVREPDVFPTDSIGKEPLNTQFPEEPQATASQPKVGEGCAIGGCSSQLCVDKSEADIASTCEWREEYGCYPSATCERQANGKCGWTMTEDLQLCLSHARKNDNQTISF